MSSVVRLHETFRRIERAYAEALAGRKPETVNIVDLLPAIFAACPEATVETIVEALRWSARRDVRHADRLRGRGTEKV